MDTVKRIYLLSYSGLTKVAIDILKKLYPEAALKIFDDNTKISENIISGELINAFMSNEDFYYFNGLGNYNYFKMRIELSNKMINSGQKNINAIHSSASLSDSCIHKGGLFMGANSSIGINTKVGYDVVIFSNSTIEHDSEIGNLCYISPGVTICGKVRIGDFCYIGPGAVIGAGVILGANSIVGAGSIVLSDVPSNKVVFGTPAKVIKENNRW